ncbi:MAG: RNA-binding transcriptional accessory protein, partial [Saprospiraceae bacterium]|nr:RNA-binding transcriptional accessory protein [Saprospiraceae bacterium]
MNFIHIGIIAKTLNIAQKRVENTIQLFAEGATIPFVARYRKEATGGLDEVQIAAIQKEQKRLEEVDKRRESILKSIEEQGKLTDELRKKIEASWEMTELEDWYLPYKRKRKTRASVAKERGLEPLAALLLEQKSHLIESLAQAYLNEEVPTVEAALQGARDIIAELVNEDPQARNSVRQVFKRAATVKTKVAKGKEEEGKQYQDYFEFEEALQKIPSHRLLAIFRAEAQGILRVSVEPQAEPIISKLERQFIKGYGKAADQVKMAIEDSYKRLLAPSIETEFRNMAKEKADTEAIDVFSSNLKQLLLTPPLGQKCVLAIDPGYRTGCKVTCLGENGDLLHHTAIYPHPPQNQFNEATKTLQHLVQQFNIQAIAIGNGTASRETVAFCQSIRFDMPVAVFTVNEAGASIYSASDVARAEFPDQDVTVRGAVSIGRRLMDPLAELVKIDPKSIGVGQYQHDVNQIKLKESLDRAVESCVNSVGININTASTHLLTYVSGLGASLANNIVQYRSEIGAFQSRAELKKVPRMGTKAILTAMRWFLA